MILGLSICIFISNGVLNTPGDGAEPRNTLVSVATGYNRYGSCILDDYERGGHEWVCPIVPTVRPGWNKAYYPVLAFIVTYAFWPIELLIGLWLLAISIPKEKKAP